MKRTQRSSNPVEVSVSLHADTNRGRGEEGHGDEAGVDRGARGCRRGFHTVF